MRTLIVIIFLIFPGILISANAKDLKDKAIICKEINNEFKSIVLTVMFSLLTCLNNSVLPIISILHL